MKTYFAKKISENWAIELELFRWFGSKYYFSLFDHSLSLKVKGDHRGLYWVLYLIGCKIFEFNVYDVRHEEG